MGEISIYLGLNNNCAEGRSAIGKRISNVVTNLWFADGFILTQIALLGPGSLVAGLVHA